MTAPRYIRVVRAAGAPRRSRLRRWLDRLERGLEWLAAHPAYSMWYEDDPLLHGGAGYYRQPPAGRDADDASAPPRR
jgi:hypothetical protein